MRITAGMTRQVHAKKGPFWGLAAFITRARCTHGGRPPYFLGLLRDPFEVGNNPGGVGLHGPRNLAGQRPVKGRLKTRPKFTTPQIWPKKNRNCEKVSQKVYPKRSLTHLTEPHPTKTAQKLARGAPGALCAVGVPCEGGFSEYRCRKRHLSRVQPCTAVSSWVLEIHMTSAKMAW